MAGCPNNSNGLKTTFPMEFWNYSFVFGWVESRRTFYESMKKLIFAAKVMAPCPNISSGQKSTFPKEFWNNSFRLWCILCWRRYHKSMRQNLFAAIVMEGRHNNSNLNNSAPCELFKVLFYNLGSSRVVLAPGQLWKVSDFPKVPYSMPKSF